MSSHHSAYTATTFINFCATLPNNLECWRSDSTYLLCRLSHTRHCNTNQITLDAGKRKIPTEMQQSEPTNLEPHSQTREPRLFKQLWMRRRWHGKYHIRKKLKTRKDAALVDSEVSCASYFHKKGRKLTTPPHWPCATKLTMRFLHHSIVPTNAGSKQNKLQHIALDEKITFIACLLKTNSSTNHSSREILKCSSENLLP